MTMISLGDGARPFALQHQNQQLKSTLQTLTNELTSGQTSDPGKTLAGSFAPLSGLVQSLGALDAYKTATGLAATVASAQQAALGSIDSAAGEVATALLTASSGAQSIQLQTAAKQATGALSSALSQLNNRAAGRSIFAGAASDHSATAPPADILDMLQTAVAGQTTAAGVEGAVKAWFHSPSGYAATGYKGSREPASAIPISAGETASLSLTAMDPNVIATLTGLALGAMVDSPGLRGNPAEQAILAKAAGQNLQAGADQRTGLRAALGTVQAQITGAQTRNTAESSALQQAQSDMLSIDPYATATQLQQTQTQLQTLYALTARISTLSLSNYLK